MSVRIKTISVVGAAALMSTGCASTFSNLVSGSSLGAAEYQPAVLVPPEKQAQYNQILQGCRQAAINRQVTSAQEAQLGTIGDTIGSVGQGAATGMQVGSLFKDAGLGTSVNRSVGIGAASGLIAGLASSFSAGISDNQEETRAALLTCLRSQASSVGYTVLE